MGDLAVCRYRPGDPLLVHGIPGESHSHHRETADSSNFCWTTGVEERIIDGKLRT